ncbi:MAG: replication factor C large subunit [Candidatus Methanoplasma sp.]|jgi:replication factor C large subunit|nr:replication factor C large subunit [Candidatus Methanoplasma sp.]
MSEDWTEKYRPRSLTGIVGNPGPSKDLLAWGRSWESGPPEKRAVVLMGPPGVGKTSSAFALANDMGWDVVEMNASDQRTGEAIKNTALRGAFSNGFSDSGEYAKGGGRRKLIILDEADNLFGNADRGALPVINELIKTTLQPVMLTVNDFYALSRKSSAIKTDTIQITIKKPSSQSVVKALAVIASAEKVSASPEALERIAENAGGDMRAAVRDLESLALGSASVTQEAAGRLSGRESRQDMYGVLDRMFRKDDPMGSRRALMEADTDPETAILWVDENLPYEYTEPGDLVRGYEKLSRADIFLGRVHRRQHYRFWAYAGDMMTAGVSVARFGRSHTRDRLKFPMYLSKMSRSKMVRNMRSSVCLKLAVFLHTSTKRIRLDMLNPIRELASNDPEIRVMLLRDAGLEQEELAFVLGCKIDSKAVKEAVAAVHAHTANAPAVHAPAAQIGSADAEATEPCEPSKHAEPVKMKEAPAPEPRGGQRNLFDF